MTGTSGTVAELLRVLVGVACRRRHGSAPRLAGGCASRSSVHPLSWTTGARFHRRRRVPICGELFVGARHGPPCVGAEDGRGAAARRRLGGGGAAALEDVKTVLTPWR